MLIELIRHGADVSRTIPDNSSYHGWSAVHLAAYYGCLASLRILLKCGVNANQPDENGYPPLYWVIIQSQSLGNAKFCTLPKGSDIYPENSKNILSDN